MAVADLRRHTGIGFVDLVLLGVFFFGTVLPLWFLGDPFPVERGNPGRWVTGALTVVYVAGLLALAVAWRSLPTYMGLVRTDHADTGDVADGVDGGVVLRGSVADGGDLLTTPVRESPAVAYLTRVQSHDPDGNDPVPGPPKDWVGKWVGEDATPFTVDDGTGTVRVDPADARLSVTGWADVTVPAGGALPDHLRSFLDRTTASVRVDPDEEDLRFAEAVLAPGDEAFVLGRASGGTVDADIVAQGDYATRIRRRVVLGGSLGLGAVAGGYLGLLWLAGLL